MGKHPRYTKGEMTYTNEEPGLFDKFIVERVAPSDRGIDHDDCWYFVLDPRHDPAAMDALLTYVTHDSVSMFRPELARDILAKLSEVYDQISEEEV